MPQSLTFVSHDMVHFGDYYTWVDLKYFAIQPETSNACLLTSLISHLQYHDHYAGQGPTEQTPHSVHGPYQLDAIIPATFEAVSVEAARDELHRWVSSWIDLEDDGPAIEARLKAEVLPKIDGEAVFRLPDIRESAEHDWGWVVGQSGFHEIVTIDRAAEMLTLLVASDD